jgi:hypothetical protein
MDFYHGDDFVFSGLSLDKYFEKVEEMTSTLVAKIDRTRHQKMVLYRFIGVCEVYTYALRKRYMTEPAAMVENACDTAGSMILMSENKPTKHRIYMLLNYLKKTKLFVPNELIMDHVFPYARERLAHKAKVVRTECLYAMYKANNEPVLEPL